MKKTRALRFGALVVGLSMVAAACGGGDTFEKGDGVLRLGGLLPETGNLAFLGPPEFAGVELAVKEINEAGGVGGADVEWPSR